jgi:hypothetical protein
MLFFSAHLARSLMLPHNHFHCISLLEEIKCKQRNILSFLCRDPEPAHHGVIPSLGNVSVRIRNMDIIVKNIKALYEVMTTAWSVYI